MKRGFTVKTPRWASAIAGIIGRQHCLNLTRHDLLHVGIGLAARNRKARKTRQRAGEGSYDETHAPSRLCAPIAVIVRTVLRIWPMSRAKSLIGG
jgi:hypothetical protein